MIAGIPYLGIHRLRVEDPLGEEVKVHMPFSTAVTNIIGTVHAGALFSLAETAAGIAAFRLGTGKAVVLLRSADVGFSRVAKEDVVATATVPSDVAKRAKADFESDERGEARVHVTVESEDGVPLFDGKFDYALRLAR